jgi:hypothetical protein
MHQNKHITHGRGVALLESHRGDDHGDRKIAEMDWGHAAMRGCDGGK